jgi:hypothetical protein
MLEELLTALESAVDVRTDTDTALESAVLVAPAAAVAALVALESAVEMFAELAEPTDVALESAMDVLRLTIEPIVVTLYWRATQGNACVRKNELRTYGTLARPTALPVWARPSRSIACRRVSPLRNCPNIP